MLSARVSEGSPVPASDAAFDFPALRAREFARLDACDHCYLDYTGAALYGSSQLRTHMALLESGLFGNPHSASAVSRASTDLIERARRDVLGFFGVDESTHFVCFCANASAAIKLVAESYRFAPDCGLLLSADNHNSVNGIREYARRTGAPVRILPLTETLELDAPLAHLQAAARTHHGLFAMPAQSNFSGALHPLALVRQARALGFDVLLDVAAYASSHRLSLNECPADFAVLSFYKMFGYPTGLGALIMRRDAISRLRRPWFAGGTVRFASVGADTHQLSAGAEGFEDGTPNFLGIAALPAGFALIEEVGCARISAYVAGLAADAHTRLLAMHHANGQPMIQWYGPRAMTGRGGTLTFNVLDAGGGVLPYALVDHAAQAAGISLRGGCFCNPGAAEAAFGLDATRLASCLAELGEQFTPSRLSACTGQAAGAIRVSFGLANSPKDVTRLMTMVDAFRG